MKKSLREEKEYERRKAEKMLKYITTIKRIVII